MIEDLQISRNIIAAVIRIIDTPSGKIFAVAPLDFVSRTFKVYLAVLSVSQFIQHRVVELMND
jgi:hypothetical protein